MKKMRRARLHRCRIQYWKETNQKTTDREKA